MSIDAGNGGSSAGLLARDTSARRRPATRPRTGRSTWSPDRPDRGSSRKRSGPVRPMWMPSWSRLGERARSAKPRGPEDYSCETFPQAVRLGDTPPKRVGPRPSRRAEVAECTFPLGKPFSRSSVGRTMPSRPAAAERKDTLCRDSRPRRDDCYPPQWALRDGAERPCPTFRPLREPYGRRSSRGWCRSQFTPPRRRVAGVTDERICESRRTFRTPSGRD